MNFPVKQEMGMNIRKSYPSKLTLNLVMKDKKRVNAVTFVPLLIAVIFCSFLFSKFAVIDQLNRITVAQSLENEAERRLEKLMEYTVDYDKVLREYNKNASIGGLLDYEQDYIDRMELLSLIKTYFIDAMEVNSYSFSANTLSIKIKSIDLLKLSELLRTLESLPVVDSVSISNAGSADKTASAVTMTLTLLRIDTAE